MFTGIIQAIGQIAEQQAKGSDMRMRISTGKLDLSDVASIPFEFTRKNLPLNTVL